MNQHDAYSRATALCSKSEKCAPDIRKKLYDWQVEPSLHDAVIDALVDNKYIDEARFAAYFVRDKYRFNGWGKIKIRYQLQQKQIPAYLIEQAFEEIDEELYHEQLVRALRNKYKHLNQDDRFVCRQKLMRFAAGRGFSPDEINKALETIL